MAFLIVGLLNVLLGVAVSRGAFRPARLYVLGCAITALLITGGILAYVVRAYWIAREQLAYIKLYAYDILQSLSIGVITSDLDGCITNVNERATTLLDLSPNCTQRPFREVLSGFVDVVRNLERLVTRKEEFTGVNVDIPSGSAVLTLRLDGRLMKNNSGKVIGAVLQAQDVTQLKLLDDEMRRTEKLAGLGTLAAGIAHEIRNPLSGLSINVQLLEEALRVKALPGKAAKNLEVVKSEVNRLQDIVDNFVAFARPRPIERAPVALEAILDSIFRLVEPECERRGIQTVREGFSVSPVRLMLDEGQIQQALLNIVINAIQAMPGGGQVTCRLKSADSFAIVDVADTGPGIPPEIRNRIFELFFTTKRGGTGLGLYLAQRIIAEHKGYVTVESNGRGTMFTIGLPIEAAP